MDVVDLFQKQNTRDELGIGTVRDAIADLLAPGLSTIQTRARYFLFIPWAYLRLEGRRCPSAEIARRARDAELRAAESLTRCADARGTIGLQAGRALQRLASSVYWGGLGVLGIRLFVGGQDQYHRSLDRFYATGDSSSSIREDPESERFARANWHPHLPAPPDDFPDSADFLLKEKEARYLQDRFQSRTPGSLVAFLTQRDLPIDGIRFPWEEPLLAAYPQPLRSHVEHARCFSEVMHGAALLYNLMLCETLPRADWIGDYEAQLLAWRDNIVAREPDLDRWNREDFWTLARRQNARLPVPTVDFIQRWMALVIDDKLSTVGSPAQRELIRTRESRLKGARARLLNREYLTLYSGSAAADQLDYRWGTTQEIAGDILRGLRRGRADAEAA